MATIFKYKDKLYQAMNLDKKLKRLKINKEDIDVIYNADVNSMELERVYLQMNGNDFKEVAVNDYIQPFYRYINPNNEYDTFLMDRDVPEVDMFNKHYVRKYE